MPSRTARHREVDPVHRAEDRVVQRVEADRHPPQARVGERLGERAQRGAVGRQGQVELAAVRPLDRRQHRDQVRQVAPDERLAPGDPQLLGAEPDEDAGDPLDLLEREDLIVREERVVAPEDLLRHAVRAAEVAAVRDRDPQVAHGPAEQVPWVGRARSRNGCERGCHECHILAPEPRFVAVPSGTG